MPAPSFLHCVQTYTSCPSLPLSYISSVANSGLENCWKFGAGALKEGPTEGGTSVGYNAIDSTFQVAIFQGELNLCSLQALPDG